MSLIGARPYTCPNGHHFWIDGEDTAWGCPCCDRAEVRYDARDTPFYIISRDDDAALVDEEGNLLCAKCGAGVLVES